MTLLRTCGRCAHLLMVALLALLVVGSDPAFAQRRVALVIGNAAYGQENKLANPVNDARLIARSLRTLGFKVEEKSDLTKRDMELAITRFTRESTGADTAVLYYAGHGAQLVGGGRNYLLPVDARVDGDDTLESDGIPADRIVEQLERGQNPAKLRLVILDACRNNSLAGRARSGVRGLARMTPADDFTLIAFSTNDQDVALDGRGENSPYTQALAKHLVKANEMPLRRIFELTASEVREATNQQQRPRTYGDLDSRAMLDGRLAPSVAVAPPPAAPAVAAPSGGPAPPSAEQVEMQAWAEVQNAKVAAGYRAYLVEYPEGRFAKFARIELAKLESAQPPARSQPQPQPQAAPGPAEATRLPEARQPQARPAARPADTPAPRPAPPVVAPAAETVAEPRPAPAQQVALAPAAVPKGPPAAAVRGLEATPGRTFRYRVTDRSYGRKIDVLRQVTAVEAGRVVFGNGARVEDAQGQLLAATVGNNVDFELTEPPQGWASLLSVAAGSDTLTWTARDGLQLAMEAPKRLTRSVTAGGQSHEAVVVLLEGQGRWPGDLAGGSYRVRFEISFDPDTRRVLRMSSVINASRTGQSGFRNSSEETELVAVQ